MPALRQLIDAALSSRYPGDLFARVQAAAHDAATSPYSREHPTDAQLEANRYRTGRVDIQGLPVRIENPYGTRREKPGRWSNLMTSHYGDIAGTKGADGDPVDVFIGPFPEMPVLYVVNQRDADGGFDEHKVCIGYASEQEARTAYLSAYAQGWDGLESIVRATVAQLKWWLKFGDKSRPFTPDVLPYEGNQTMDKVLWNPQAEPVTKPLHTLMYELRTEDAEAGLMLDALSMADLMADPDITALPVLDAMVVEAGRLQPKMEALQRIMEAAGGTVKPTEMSISDPVRYRGVAQVMVLFTMADGQTVSVWFHNPDTTPAKLMPLDELISWKWMLNKKDVTIVVAPEKGRDLNPREVARRIMRLVERNSEAFQKANAKTAEKAATLAALDTEIAGLEVTLADLNRKIEVAKVEAEDRKASEPHYSDLTLQALIENHGWKAAYFDGPGETGKVVSVSREFVGVGPLGTTITPDGMRRLAAGYGKDRERRRYIELSLGDTVIGDWDGRDQDPAAVAALVNEAAEQFVNEKRAKNGLPPLGEDKPVAAWLRKNGEGSDGLPGIGYEDSWKAKSALDEIDKPVGSYYVWLPFEREVKFSFNADTAMKKATKRVGKEEFFKLMEIVVRWSNKEIGEYSQNFLSTTASRYLALYHGIDQKWAQLAYEQAYLFGDAGVMPAVDEAEIEQREAESRAKVLKEIAEEARFDDFLAAVVIELAYKGDLSAAGAKKLTDDTNLVHDGFADKVPASQVADQILAANKRSPVADRAYAIAERLIAFYGWTKAVDNDTPLEGVNLESPRDSERWVYLGDSNGYLVSDEHKALEFEFDPERSTDAELAQNIDRADFNAELDTNDDGVVGEGNEFEGKTPEFAYAAEVLRKGATAAGASVHFGDFSGSSTESMFDKATPATPYAEVSVYGITAQIGVEGKVLARAMIDEDGKIVILKGSGGDKPWATPQNVVDVREAVTRLIAEEAAKPAPVVAPEPVKPGETTAIMGVSEGEELGDDVDPVAAVDAAYQFDDATDSFKREVFESLADTEYSTFFTAKTIDLAVKKHGARASWGFESSLDSVDGGAALDDADYPLLDGVPLSVRAMVVDTPVHQRVLGARQVAFADWGVNGGVALVEADDADRKEFGPGVFRTGKGEMTAGELIVRIDPKGMKLYFVDNDHYRETDEVKWQTPVKLKTLAINDLAKFNKAYGASIMDGAAILDAAADLDIVIGTIKQGSKIVGRAHVGGDGKAMIFTGKAGEVRVKYLSTVDGKVRDCMWSDDDAADMVDHLFTLPENGVAKATAKTDPEPAVPADNDLTRLNALKKLAPKGRETVSSDDPQIIEKLRAKLDYLSAYGDFMRKANKLVRKQDRAGLAAMGFKGESMESLFKPDFAGRIGFADYEMTNNNGVMRTTRLRLEEVMKKAAESKAAEAPATTGRFRYALVNRPADIGTVPKVAYTVEPRPVAGQPHHDMARHGILVTERELTDEEVKTFELAPLVDGPMLDELALKIAGNMSRYAARYVAAEAEDPGQFRETVLDKSRTVGNGIRYSVATPDALVDRVLVLLQDLAAIVVPDAEETTPAVEPVAQNPDVAFLQSMIDGGINLLDPALVDKLEPMFEQYANDPAMMDMLNRAANAYGDAAIAAAKTALGA